MVNNRKLYVENESDDPKRKKEWDKKRKALRDKICLWFFLVNIAWILMVYSMSQVLLTNDLDIITISPLAKYLDPTCEESLAEFRANTSNRASVPNAFKFPPLNFIFLGFYLVVLCIQIIT